MRRRADGRLYALKVTHLPSLAPAWRQALLDEAVLLAGLVHPALVAWHEAFVAGGQLCLVMQLVEGSDLASQLRWVRVAAVCPPHVKQGGPHSRLAAHRSACPLPVPQPQRPAPASPRQGPQPRGAAADRGGGVAAAAAGGRSAGASARAAHCAPGCAEGWGRGPRPVGSYSARESSPAALCAPSPTTPDLKPENLLVSSDGAARLCDLGAARALGAVFTRRAAGTPAYYAPEQHAGRAYSFSSDVWALGVLAWEAAALRRLFAHDSEAAVRAAVLAGSIPPLPQRYSTTLRLTIASLLRPDPAARPTAAELLACPAAAAAMDTLPRALSGALQAAMAQDLHGEGSCRGQRPAAPPPISLPAVVGGDGGGLEALNALLPPPRYDGEADGGGVARALAAASTTGGGLSPGQQASGGAPGQQQARAQEQAQPRWRQGKLLRASVDPGAVRLSLEAAAVAATAPPAPRRHSFNQAAQAAWPPKRRPQEGRPLALAPFQLGACGNGT